MKNKFIIENKTRWIRSIRPGETKTGYVKKHSELDSLCTLVSRFNKGYGRELGLCIRSNRCWEEKSFTITCALIEEP
jgi:hypothetical protein